MLAAARDALEARPPSAITGRQVAKAAGAHYSLIHRHFGSNETLLSAALIDIGKRLRDDVFHEAPELPTTADLREHSDALRAKAFARLDGERYPTIRAESRLAQRYLDIISMTRTRLSDVEVAALTATTVCLQMGVVLLGDVASEWVGLRSRDAYIDQSVDRWILGATAGSGPLAIEPISSRQIIETEEPGPDDNPTLTGRAATEMKLVEAGADLLTESSPTAISGRSIAAAAGVNYGLIHHYFGSKDVVLRQSLALYRDRFRHYRPGYRGSADYFAVLAIPGFARAVAWAALDPDRPFDGGPFPIGSNLLSTHLADGEEPTDAIRVSLLAVTVAQLAWSLFSEPLANTLGHDTRDLEPLAASLLHEIITEGRRTGD